MPPNVHQVIEDTFRQESGRVIATLIGLVRDFDFAEDVLQDAFISAFQNLNSYREDATFGAWLKRIVVNKALNHAQKSKKDWMLAEEIKEEEDEYD